MNSHPTSPSAEPPSSSAPLSASGAASHDTQGFPWLFFGTALLVFCLGHWIGAQTLHFLHLRDAILVPGSLAAVISLSWVLSTLHHRHPRPAGRGGRFLHFFLTILILVSSYLFATGVEHWLAEGPMQLAIHPLAFVLICVGSLALLEPLFRRLQIRVQRHWDVRPQLHQNQEASAPVEALIMFVSTPTPDFSLEFLTHPDEAISRHATVHFAGGKSAILLGRGHLLADIEGLSQLSQTRHWNWQQLLRAVRDHEKLRRVILLGSTSDEGSHRHLEECRRFLQPYLPEGCLIENYGQPLDFTDFNKLFQTLRILVLRTLKKFPTSHIAIDVTGGQATASIAGAATTVNVDCVFQYVNTNKPFNLMTYDVLLDHGPGLH